MIGSALLSALDSPLHNHYVLWYYALDSQNEEVRNAAEKVLVGMATDRSDHRLQRWAEAMVDRYGHPPSDLEMLTDPLVKLAWAKDRSRASENQQKLTVLTKEVYGKRQGEVKK